MLQKIIRYAATGLAIGSIVSCACLCLMSLAYTGAVHPVLVEVMAWLGASLVYGLASMLFEWERLSLPLATALHMVICLAITLLVAYGLGYGAGVSLLMGVTPVFLVIYAVIYLAFTLHDRRCAQQANQRLKARPNGEEDA